MGQKELNNKVAWLTAHGYPYLYKANKLLEQLGEGIDVRRFKRGLNGTNLLPFQKWVAIMAFHEGIKYPLRYALENTHLYLAALEIPKMLPIRPKRVEDEFEAQGFVGVPCEGLSNDDGAIKAIRKIGMNKRYGFVISNTYINGKLYIYPEEFANDYNALLEKKRYLPNAYSYLGVPGYTKLFNQEGEI